VKKFVTSMAMTMAMTAATLGFIPHAHASDWRPLLDERLSQFDVYLSYRGDQILSVIQGRAPASLRPIGLNPGRQDVFTVSLQDGKPVLRVSGEIYGCISTREDFSNYHLRASYKWGTKVWEPRLTEPRDSGILYHSRGEFGVDYWKSWAQAQEMNVMEKNTGEYWTIANVAIDIRARPQKADEAAPHWDPSAPWMEFKSPNNHALAGSDEERPGEWNQIELICVQDRCVHVVNGTVVMALKNARTVDGDRSTRMTGGKLQIQSEAAEVFFRDLEIRPITDMPAKYARYFDGG
jgi:hypothetical protein